MTASAPRTGRSAAAPGNGVSGVKNAAAAPIAASPSHEQRGGSRTPASARRAPSPNSHARVGVTKYADGRLRAREVDRVGEAREREPPSPARARRGAGDRQRGDRQQQRPDEIELLLHRQRPEVPHGRRAVLGGEVVDRRAREVPVLDVEDARADLGEVLRPVGRRHEQDGGRAAAAEHEQRRGQDPPRAPHPEGAETRRGRDCASSRSRCAVIRKPEIAKKTSTPTNPPGTADGHR